MKKIKIYDSNFAHAKYMTDFQKCKFFEWTRGNDQTEEIVFVSDNFLTRVNNVHDKKYALLMEPPSISPGIYRYIESNNKSFEKVLTYEKSLIDKGENYEFYPHGGCWIAPEDQKIYHKTKNVSIIASSKNWTEGHKLRHDIISKARNIDVYGRGYNPVKYKKEALQDYRFSIVIENCRKDYYFTEKLIDCFMTGTIPIYWGCPSIGKFFDTNGMIIVENHEDTLSFLQYADQELYDKKLEQLKNNFKIAKKYIMPENWIYQNVIKKNG
jgi:hypothetical protein